MLQEKPFSHRVKHTELFNPPKLVFGEDVPIPQRKLRISTAPAMVQEVPFKPARPPRTGFKCTFNMPVHIADPIRFAQRVRTIETDEEQRRAFRNST